MRLSFSFNEIEPIWIPGELPLKRKSRRAKVRLGGKSDSHFPPILEVGDLLSGARPSPPEYFVTLLLTYPHGTVPFNLPAPKEGEWSDVPGSTIYGQVRIPLPAEAIAAVTESNGSSYDYEVTLENVELENKTKYRRVPR
jgi:hypothetical protein